MNVVLIKSLITKYSEIPQAKVTSYDDLAKKAAGYWKIKENNPDLALPIAQFFDSRLMILGDYAVSRERDHISISVRVYDVVTGEIKLNRSYENTGDDGIFETIDRMARNISGLLVQKKENSVGNLDSSSDKIQIEKTNSLKINDSQTILDYTGQPVFLNLLLPGIVQLRANDTGWGLLYMGSAVAGAGITGLSIAGVVLANDLNTRNTDPVQAEKYSRWVGEWTAMLVSGCVVLAASAGVSYFHALALQDQDKKAKVSWFYDLDPLKDGLQFKIAYKF